MDRAGHGIFLAPFRPILDGECVKKFRFISETVDHHHPNNPSEDCIISLHENHINKPFMWVKYTCPMDDMGS